MNIFATDPSPVKSALALDDLRVNKMIVESAQMLSTAVHLHSSVAVKGIYKPCYKYHPCTIWTRDNQSNFDWLVQHALALCVIFERNSYTEHKTQFVIQLCDEYKFLLPKGDLTPFANCTPFKGVEYNDFDVCELYRMTMRNKWETDIKPPKWTNRKYPNWL